MINLQYTLRGIPPFIDLALRETALRERRSLNAVAIDALARGLNASEPLVIHSELDSLIGSWREEEAFDAAVAEFGKVDTEVWK